MTNGSTSNIHLFSRLSFKICPTYLSLKIPPPPPPPRTPMNLFIANRKPLINISPELKTGEQFFPRFILTVCKLQPEILINIIKYPLIVKMYKTRQSMDILS